MKMKGYLKSITDKLSQKGKLSEMGEQGGSHILRWLRSHTLKKHPQCLINGMKTQNTITFVFAGVPAYIKPDIKCLECICKHIYKVLSIF